MTVGTSLLTFRGRPGTAYAALIYFGVHACDVGANARDLEGKLVDFRQYDNRDRTHQSPGGDSPMPVSGEP